MAHRRQKRRGVLLLVSLVLLVLFLMLGVTFVLMAGNFRRSSEAYRRLQESGNTQSMAEDLLHGVAHDLVRGTHNPESPFSKENLLEDMYGQPALRGKVTALPPPPTDTGGQFTTLEIGADADFSFSSVAGYYSGLVLTMVTGEAAHQSTRIVDSSSNTLTVMTLPGWVDPSSAPQVDDLILVNGRPFSGDGTGHAANATTRRLNEDYDAADGNNPWLADRSAATPEASWSDTGFEWGTPSYNRPVGTQATLDTDGVDNDGDGKKESLWIDAGLPLQTQSDGRLVKPLVAMLVRDLDGRVNVNAHGSADQLAALAGASTPIGQGYGPAEINPDFVSDEVATAVLLQGRPADPSQGLLYIKGRHADVPETETNPVPGRSGDDPLSAVAQFHHYGGDLNALVTPHDIDGTSTAVANATTGQIEFQDTSGDTFTNTATDFQDDPYEMQLDTALGSPQDDSPFTPGDLEAVFRHRDVDAGSLSDRLQTALTVGVADANKPAAYDSFRNLITTESWDLPVHPVALPAELADPPLLSDPPAHISDLITARIMKSQGEEDEETARTQAIALIDSGLVDREMLAGLKFNVNRLFGNGKDDDTDSSDPGYGVVDEPGETKDDNTVEKAYGGSVSGAPVPGHFSDVNFDHNGDGFTFPWDFDEDGDVWPAVDDPEDRPYRMADLAVRQQYARQLYLLLMLVSNIDDDLKDVVTQVTDPDDRRRLLARRLAQFAVNAVDYRDADSIMTGFEYDANPFDAAGWLPDADGDLNTTSSDSEFGLVWGAETPAAVLTGTLALHDMRVKDMAAVGGGKTTVAKRDDENIESQLPDPLPNPGEPLGIAVQDEDFDQYAPPQGSLFLQIHALPNAYPTRDLYQSTGELKLSKTHNDTASGDPVWRVAISAPHPLGQSTKNTAGQGLPVFNVGEGSPVFNQLRDVNTSESVDATEETASQWNPLVTMQPDSFDALQDTLDENEVQNQVVIERVVYFANTTGSATPEDAQYYNQDSTDVLLTPGASKVVGPRAQTSVRAAGFTTDTVTSDVVCTLYEKPSGWTGDGTNPGMSVSEPLPDSYYTDAGTVDDPMTSGDKIYSPAFDSPFDQTKELGDIRAILEKNDVATITDEQTPPGTVDVDRPSIEGTVENYCTAFLQRLANPLLPWNPLPDNADYDPALEVNPYITVDAMPIDLTVYNGDGGGVVWSTSTIPMTVAELDENSKPQYPDHLYRRGWRERAKLAEPMGTLNASLTEPSASAITTTSDPAPFWPNRPFVSQYELLMVPASEPGKLSFELGTHSGDPQANFHEGFPHLLNFFYEVSSEPRLGRIFDYLHVPSRYAGTQTTLRPDNFAGVADFAPPFNRISNYREPGRVNLNTIEEASVWESVIHGVPGDVTAHPGAAYSGHPQGNNIQGKLFRASSYAELDGEPLDAAQPPLLTSGGSSPMFADASQTADPFLRYGPINRLGNLVGTRSNVYAVWMTLGFFEVDSSGTVGNEAGSDTGEIGRHRAFYMIDRSIPVGYENGQDHNTEDVFRMQRFIE